MILAQETPQPLTESEENEEQVFNSEGKSAPESFEDNEEAMEFQKYQEEVRALEKSYFQELMEECKERNEEKTDQVEQVADKQDRNPEGQNEIVRTAKENLENKVNHLNEIEIIRTELNNLVKTGTRLKGSQLDRNMLNDEDSSVYVLQGSDFKRMDLINDEAYVKINGQYVKADRKSDTQQSKGKPACPNPNEILQQLKSIVDQRVAHVELTSATSQTPPPTHRTSQLLQLYNQQLQLYNQRLPKPAAPASQVLKSQCSNANSALQASNALRKMTEISVALCKQKPNTANAQAMNLEEESSSLEVDVPEKDLLQNLTQEEIVWFSRCNFCTKSLNISNMAELLVHCRECSELDRSQGRFTYICYVCGVYNSYKSTNMKKHLLTHLGHKAFACNSCQYTCVTRSDLQRHERKHTGEKPYACHLCEYRASRTETLKKHQLNIHKIVNASVSIPELNVYNALLSGKMKAMYALGPS